MKGVRLILLSKQSCIHAFVAGRREPFADMSSVHVCVQKARHRSRINCEIFFYVVRRCCALLLSRIPLIFYHILVFHVRTVAATV